MVIDLKKSNRSQMREWEQESTNCLRKKKKTAKFEDWFGASTYSRRLVVDFSI